MNKAILNWSGGKDSSMTLYRLRQNQQYDIQCLLTTVSDQYQRISMHGVRLDLLKQQAESIGIPLYPVMIPEAPTMQSYDSLMEKVLSEFKEKGTEYSIFGDIFLEDLKKYREDCLAKVNLKGVFPIWKRPTDQLVREFIDVGFKAVLVCVNERYLDKSFAGRTIDNSLLNDLPSDVDPCGENGEFHSFVYDGPIFKKPVKFRLGEIVHKKYEPVKDESGEYDNTPSDPNYDTGFWYCDLTS